MQNRTLASPQGGHSLRILPAAGEPPIGEVLPGVGKRFSSRITERGDIGLLPVDFTSSDTEVKGEGIP